MIIITNVSNARRGNMRPAPFLAVPFAGIVRRQASVVEADI